MQCGEAWVIQRLPSEFHFCVPSVLRSVGNVDLKCPRTLEFKDFWGDTA